MVGQRDGNAISILSHSLTPTCSGLPADVREMAELLRGPSGPLYSLVAEQRENVFMVCEWEHLCAWVSRCCVHRCALRAVAQNTSLLRWWLFERVSHFCARSFCVVRRFF